MRSLKSLAVASVIAFGVVIATACGSSGDGGDGSSGGASGGPIGGDPGSSGQLPGGTPAEELKGCASETKKATPLPLDLYIMFDSSGSMAALIAANKTKYTAAVEAMN